MQGVLKPPDRYRGQAVRVAENSWDRKGCVLFESVGRPRYFCLAPAR